MLLMLLIGWIVLLPALVVAGLYVGASLLGRRRAAFSVYEDLFADEPDSVELPASQVLPAVHSAEAAEAEVSSPLSFERPVVARH